MRFDFPKNISAPAIPQAVKVSQHSIFEAVALIVIGILVYIFLMQPKLAELKSKQGILIQIEKEQTAVANTSSDLDRLIGELKDNEKNIIKMDEALPLKQNATGLQILLESLSKLSGMTIGEVSVDLKGDDVVAANRKLLEKPFGYDRTVGQLQATIGLTGSFEQFERLIERIETNARIMDIESVEIATAKGDTLDFKIALTAYYFMPQ